MNIESLEPLNSESAQGVATFPARIRHPAFALTPLAASDKLAQLE